MKTKNKHITTIIALALLLLSSCSKEIIVSRHIDKQPNIYPEYKNAVLPANICPIHFTTEKPVKDMNAIFESADVRIEVPNTDDQIAISEKDWNKLREASSKIRVRLQVMEGEQWVEYAPFTLEISKDSIDPYMAYRLIEPGYEVWNEMGIYQRCLENFDEEAIITNKMTGHNCMNCHTFCNQDPDKMLFHMRKDYGATYMIDGDNIEALDTKTPDNISAFVYPAWHPSGDFVAFSTNETKQMFHTTDRNRIEVFDFKSDVIVYDVKNNEVLSTPLLKRSDKFETFPTFSPDGKTLYFCRADSVQIPQQCDSVRYNLCAIAFDPVKKEFGDSVYTVIDAASVGKSISFPRISPDGKNIAYTVAGYGNFHVWHKEASLCVHKLPDYTTSHSFDEFGIAIEPLPHDPDLMKKLDMEYNCSGGFGGGLSWSSNSKWLIYSRRIDGLYTRPFIGHINHLPGSFILPQDDARHYDRLTKSFNLPEMIRGKVKASQFSIAHKAHEQNPKEVK